MGPEVNIDYILALENQIKEGVGDVANLKRSRNSLLNISMRVPPEILGHVFRWSIAPGSFCGSRKGSYNFLLVCHHWFEVASSTPELWTYWGNTLKQWSHRCQRSGTVPIDLVLNAYDPMHGGNDVPFDGPVREALQDRTAHDSIRSVRLQGWDTDLLRSVISSLTLDGEDIRYSSIESLTLEYADLDISTFLTRYRFPKLRDLRLSTGPKVSSWDHLKLQAASLTTLSLRLTVAPSRPTTPQLLSILAWYPNLQGLSLHEAMIPHDVGDGSTLRVPLRHLKKLSLRGEFCHVFCLLDRLECPDALDSVDLEFHECVWEEIPEFLEPYLRDRIRRDDRFQGRLGICASPMPDSISFGVGTVGEFNVLTMLPETGHPFLSFTVLFGDTLPQGVEEKLCINLITLAPLEHVVYFIGGFSPDAMRDLLVAMPNIEYLNLEGSAVSDTFLHPDPVSHTKLLPSLRHLCLCRLTLQNDDDWSPLVAYLTHQTSGGQVISLRLCGGCPPLPPEVVREIEGLVEEFHLGYPSNW